MNLILFESVDIPLKSRFERVAACLDSDGNVSFLIMPRIAWVKMDLETSYYSQLYGLSAISVCLNIDIIVPRLKPALLDSKSMIQLTELTRSYEIPVAMKDNVTDIFQAIQFMEEPPPRSIYSNSAPAQYPPPLPFIPPFPFILTYMDTQRLPPIGVELRRIGNKAGKRGDIFTRNRLSGRTMNMFHTCLRDEMDKNCKPYSIIESYALKLKGW